MLVSKGFRGSRVNTTVGSAVHTRVYVYSKQD